MEFEWDPEKDRINQEKHGVSFAEGSTAFGDPLARTVLDPRYSEGEDRFLTTGFTSASRLVIMAHTDRGERTRIISVREVLPRERRFYESKE
ncbi:MAG: BrnT family toxin [Acidobacteriota bacterium]